MSARRSHADGAGCKDKRSAARAPRRGSVAIAVVALLTLHFVLATTSVLRKSVTYDELAHLTRGVSSFLTGDFRLGPPHPPLAHYLGALPVVLGMHPRFPTLDQPAWRRSDVWSIGAQFFYGVGNDADEMLFRGRCAIALLSTALGLLVFAWSRQLFGTAGGLISLTLYAVDPTMLAHGSLVTSDLVSAAFFTAALAAIWRLSHRVSIGSVLAAVAAVGGLFLAKGSGVLIAFMGVPLLLLRTFAPPPIRWAFGGRAGEISGALRRTGVLIGLTALLVLTTDLALWAGYGFRWSPFRGGGDTPARYEAEALSRQRDYFSASPPPQGKSAWDWQMRGLTPGSAGLCRWLHEHRLLPDAYVYGFLAMLQSERGRDSFFNGHRSISGSRWFFPYAFAVKTPLPLLAMLLAAAMKRRNVETSKRQNGGRGFRTLPLWVLLVVYSIASIRSPLNIGHRHLLPLYPALLILCGAAAGWLRAATRAGRAVPVVLIGLSVLASLSMYPHYLAYFNWFAGGPSHGYQHLVDSSLDWGQDLPTLARKLKANYSDRPVYLQYFGKGLPEQAGISPVCRLCNGLGADGRSEVRLGGGIYCISATNFQQVYVLDVRDAAAIEGPGFNPASGMPVEWNKKYEAAYQEMLPAMRQLQGLPEDGAARIEFLRSWRPATYADDYHRFVKLRFMRMCSFLRRREPDDMAGYSILMFNLPDEDVRRMTEGPPPA